MALTYNLKYKKQNTFFKVLLEKEGEVVIDRQSFRLKGKGAQDQGEVIYFSDIKDFTILTEGIRFSTFHKERYTLRNFHNLFDSFLKDFFRVKNEYLADTLFMKVGMLYQEYEGQIDVTNRFGQSFNKGKAKIQFYEGSMLIIPEKSDCFAIFYNFLKSHDFDEDDYVLRLSVDSGSTIQISKLGTTFEDAQETLESLLGKMYERIVNHLKEVFPGFNAVDLLKLAFLLREGKNLQVTSLKKIHEDLPKKIQEVILEGAAEKAEEKIKRLKSKTEESNFYVGLCFPQRSERKELQVTSWFVVGLPAQNLLAVGFLGKASDQSIYFFRIHPEIGNMGEKLTEKIIEVNQSLFLSHFDLSFVAKNHQELKKTKYRTAVQKLTFMRLLRKSFLGKSITNDLKLFEKEIEKFSQLAAIPVQTNRTRPRLAPLISRA